MDLREFERSLQQLENVAETQARQAATATAQPRNQSDLASRTFNHQSKTQQYLHADPTAKVKPSMSEERPPKDASPTREKPENSRRELLDGASREDQADEIYSKMKTNLISLMEKQQSQRSVKRDDSAQQVAKQRTRGSRSMREVKSSSPRRSDSETRSPDRRRDKERDRDRDRDRDRERGRDRDRDRDRERRRRDKKSSSRSPDRTKRSHTSVTPEKRRSDRRRASSGSNSSPRRGRSRERGNSLDDLNDFTQSGRHLKMKANSEGEEVEALERDPDMQVQRIDSMPMAMPLESLREQARMNALRVVDIYRQLKNSALKSLQDLDETEQVQMEIAHMNDSRRPLVDPDTSVSKIYQTVNQEQQTFKPVGAPVNPSNTDIINSSLVHVLTAFAIAEDQQDIFLRVKAYLTLRRFQLPKLNGIYSYSDWREARACKTSYLHHLFSNALQVAIHANWMVMCHAILIHCQAQRLTVTVTKMDISRVISNDNHDLANLLIEYGAYFDRKETSIQPEKLLVEEETPVGPDEMNATGFNKSNALHSPSTNLDLKSAAARESKTPGPFTRPQQLKRDYSKALSNLDQTVSSIRFDERPMAAPTSAAPEKPPHEETMIKTIKKGLFYGHTLINASHFIKQFFDDKVDADKNAENQERFQREIRTLLKALSHSKRFESVVPMLVLRGSRPLAYELLTDKRKSAYSFELSFDVQKRLAVEFFCFSLSQEQLDEALNIYMKFPNQMTQVHRKRCLTELMQAFQRSATFLELKYYLLSKFFDRMTQEEVMDLLDTIETKLIAQYSHTTAQRSALLQNCNSLRATLQTLFILGTINKLIPHMSGRITTLSQRLIDYQTAILDIIPNTEFDKIIVSANKKDIFGNDVLWYLSFAKPYRLLQTEVIRKMIDQYWTSSYGNSTVLMHYSACAQVIFHRRLAGTNALKMLLRNDEEMSRLTSMNEHILLGINFEAWRKGINLRFGVDVGLTLVLVLLLHYIVIAFMEDSVVISDSNIFVMGLRYILRLDSMEDLNKIEQPGLFVAFSYTFLITGYVLLSVISKGCLNMFYLIHTGQRGQQHISASDLLLLGGFLVYAAFFLYATFRTPTYYESIADWGTLIDDGILLTFVANLRNMSDYEGLVISVRFWPCVPIFVLWLHVFARLQFARWIGSYVIMMRLAAVQFMKYAVFWLLSLFFFAGVTVVWVGEYANYSTFTAALESLYLTAFGLRARPAELDEAKEGGFYLLHSAFVVINIIWFLSFLTSVMTNSLVHAQSEMTSLQNGYFIDRLPVQRYKPKVGWIATLPTAVSPFFLLIVYPLYLLVEKISLGGHAFNIVMCGIQYLPIALAQSLFFVILNVFMIPVAYIMGLWQLILKNPYQDRKTKGWKGLQIIGFFLFGLPFLVLCQLPNTYYCFKSLVCPKRTLDALHNQKSRELPLHTRNFQRLYQVVSREVLRHGQVQGNSFIREDNKQQTKRLLERLRSTLGIQNCVKTLFFGSIPGFSRGSNKFMNQLKREDQTITKQLECYNMLKNSILCHKELNSGKLRLGLLFQYVQEIKMKIVATKCIQNFEKGLELKMVDFTTIPRKEWSDTIAREILQANPHLVLRVLQAEELASTGLKDSFLIHHMSAMTNRILTQMRRQAISHVLMQGATLEQIRDNASLTSFDKEMPVVEDPNVGIQEPQVSTYQIAIAQQEAIQDLAKQLQAESKAMLSQSRNSKSLSAQDIAGGKRRSAPGQNLAFAVHSGDADVLSPTNSGPSKAPSAQRFTPVRDNTMSDLRK